MITIIPARAGSVRVPQKNTRPFLPDGTTLLDLAVRVATEHANERWPVVVTTDIPDYDPPAGVLRLARPADLATADAIIVDELCRILAMFPDADPVLLLQPTQPLRTVAHLARVVRAYALVDAADARPISAVCTITHSPLGLVRDGTAYLASRDTILRHRNLYGTKTIYLPIDPLETINIDTEQDWTAAQTRLKEQAWQTT